MRSRAKSPVGSLDGAAVVHNTVQRKRRARRSIRQEYCFERVRLLV